MKSPTDRRVVFTLGNLIVALMTMQCFLLIAAQYTYTQSPFIGAMLMGSSVTCIVCSLVLIIARDFFGMTNERIDRERGQ